MFDSDPLEIALTKMKLYDLSGIEGCVFNHLNCPVQKVLIDRLMSNVLVENLFSNLSVRFLQVETALLTGSHTTGFCFGLCEVHYS